MICASAPALKVFFRRYFSLSNASGGYTRSGSNQMAIPMSRSRGRPQVSNYSATASRARHDNEVESGLPFAGIKVSQGLDIRVEERDRDDLSQKSYASTRNLTALPKSERNRSSDWTQGCRTLCTALKPSSRNNSKPRSPERDVERGPAGS